MGGLCILPRRRHGYGHPIIAGSVGFIRWPAEDAPCCIDEGFGWGIAEFEAKLPRIVPDWIEGDVQQQRLALNDLLICNWGNRYRDGIFGKEPPSDSGHGREKSAHGGYRNQGRKRRFLSFVL